MDAMTNPAGPPLFLVNMQLMEIGITISKSGLIGPRVCNHPFGVAAKTEGIIFFKVRLVKILRKFTIEQRFHGSTMGIVTTHTFAILDRLMLRFGVGDIRLNVVMTAEADGPLRIH